VKQWIGSFRDVTPRIGPGGTGEIGRLNAVIVRAIGAATGGRPPNVFTTLARHRGLFRRWLWFAGGLMPGGVLPRAETELLILRVAHNADSEYEWSHHERIGREAGLADVDIERVRQGPEADGWSDRQAVLLRAADELHEDRRVSDETWAALRPLLSDAQMIEVCMLVGHYEMLAMTLNSVGVELDEAPVGAESFATRVLRRRTAKAGPR
jgi:alkylhydroperoxidase family enzyme